jgi:single-stranded-DNA-specific exonuclease
MPQIMIRWNFQTKPKTEQVLAFAKELNVTSTIASLLIQRGVTNFEEARLFFKPTWEDLHDPFLMKDMNLAVERIEKAIINKENILVYGDYDVDGTTAVALMSSYLETIHPEHIDTYIPDRYLEGYGISTQGIDYADDNGFSLIVALDCGIKSIDKVLYAKTKNIDFIICDHHRPGNELPDAVAVLDPKREDCNYPFDELCGCGVGFKLIQAITQKRGYSVEILEPYLDLVATAIGADIVPMKGENRILAKFGLEVINRNPRPGIKALCQSLKKLQMNITDVVFVIAPRINAAGRIKHGNYAVQLLTEFDEQQAFAFAAEIEAFNAERKDLDKQTTIEALQQIVDNQEEKHNTTVVFHEHWHKGVIGIVASRLTETYYRPTVVFTKSGDKLAASARSVRDFDLYNALDQCQEHLEQFGGHMYAAGLTLNLDQYKNFKNKFEEVVSASIPKELLIPEIKVDLPLALQDIDEKFMRILNRFEPFGPENMRPVFWTENVFDTGYAKTMGQQEEHLKLFIRQGNSEGFVAIGFGLGNKISAVENRKPFQALFSLEENEWNDQKSIQIKLRDLKL